MAASNTSADYEKEFYLFVANKLTAITNNWDMMDNPH